MPKSSRNWIIISQQVSSFAFGVPDESALDNLVACFASGLSGTGRSDDDASDALEVAALAVVVVVGEVAAASWIFDEGVAAGVPDPADRERAAGLPPPSAGAWRWWW